MHDKLDIADEMLDAAIVQFLDQRRYFAALNLAAVAEELYGKHIRIIGLRDSQQENIETVDRIARNQGITDFTIKSWKKIATHQKNSIKHYDAEADRFIEIDPNDEARLVIFDALANHTKLDREITSIVQRFSDFAQKWAAENNMKI